MKPLEFDARKYRQASSLQKDMGMAVIDEIPLRGDERILDLGCGEGGLTAELARRVPRGWVLGVDASGAMIAAARQYACANLQVRRMDIRDITFENEFDVVFSNSTLHWIKDHRRLLGSICRALVPGGIVRAGFAGDGNTPTLNAVLRQTMSEAPFAAAFRGFDWPWFMPSADEYKALLVRSPFEQHRVWVENNDRYFANAADMTGWIEQPCLVPFLAHLGDDLKSPFRDLVVERTIARAIRPDGRCFEAFRRVNMWAKR